MRDEEGTSFAAAEAIGCFDRLCTFAHPTWRHLSCLILSICFSAIAGCGGGIPGIQESLLDGLPVLTVTEDLRIGSVEDPDYGFSRIRGVEVDRDGRLFVGESLVGEIRVFDSDGTLLRRIGRKGEGPGEFQQLFQWGVVGDTVWVTDFFLRRITLFERAGTLLSTGIWEGVTVPHGTSGSASSVGPYSMRVDGLFRGEITEVAQRMGGAPSEDSLRVPEVLFDASGVVVDTVGWDVFPPPAESRATRVSVGSRNYPVPRPPTGTVPRLGFPAGEWIVDRHPAQADSLSNLKITRLGLMGDTIVSREYRYQPRRYPDVILDSIAMRYVSARPSARGTDPDRVRQAIRDAMDFPDFQPPVLEGVAGSDGTLWLRREDLGGRLSRWLVIGPDGTPRGHVEIPRHSTVSWVGEGVFVVVEKDEFDVPWVVRFRIGD